VVQEAYVQGVSTRSVDDLVQAMGMTGISKSQVSRLEHLPLDMDHRLYPACRK
jgi:transposase-like protein